MNIRKLLLSVGIVFIATFLSAKEYHLSGKIIDANNKTPIPYATLLLKNSIYGTQTNEKGVFTLNLPHGYENDTLSIKVLSYEEKLLAISDMKKNTTIALTPIEEILDEVIVYATSAKEILKKAAKNWEKNHDIETSQVQRCFSRELMFEKGVCFKVGEGIVDRFTLIDTEDSISQVSKLIKARGIQDSAILWRINDVLRLKNDTISMNDLFSGGLAGADLVPIIIYLSVKDSKINEKNKPKQEKKSKRKKKKEVELNIPVSLSSKYGGIIKHNNRATYRVNISIQENKQDLFKGQLLIDSATYAYTGIQLSNQKVDLYKKIVPWYAKLAIRIMGYKPEVKHFNFSCLYRIAPNKKWVKSYDYMRYGGKITKKRQTIDGYVESEFIYELPIDTIFKDKDSLKNKSFTFKETRVSSFDDDKFWKPYNVPYTPQRVKDYVHAIHKANMVFEGSIGYNKKESKRIRKANKKRK